MKLITDDGLFSLPLFHGTSDFFGRLIMQSALGADDIISQWHVIELAREVVALLKECGVGSNLSDDSFMLVDGLRKMARQEITAGGSNYRHGSVYLSAAQRDASNYASKAKGSEILTYTYHALKLLPSAKKDAGNGILGRYPEASNAMSVKHRPVILTAVKVPVEFLREENGEDPYKIINITENLLSGSKNSCELPSDEVLQLCRFELIKPIAPEYLSIESL
jgi:hypothetical protein